MKCKLYLIHFQFLKEDINSVKTQMLGYTSIDCYDLKFNILLFLSRLFWGGNESCESDGFFLNAEPSTRDELS